MKLDHTDISKYFLILKPTRCTNFSNLFLEYNYTCFGKVFCPSSGVQYFTHSNRYRSYRFADCLLASSQHNLYDIYLLLCVQCQTPDDGQKTCPKHVEFYSKNKFEKLLNFVGFIIRIYHDARSHESQIGHIFLTVFS